MKKRDFIKQCYKRYKYLYSIYGKCTEEQKIEIDITLSKLYSIISFGTKKSSVSPSIVQKLLDEKSFLDKNRPLLDIIKPLSTSEDIHLGQEPVKIKLTIHDMYELIYDFYKSTLSPEMFETFDRLFKNRHQIFHFYPYSTKEEACEYYLDFFHETHMLIPLREPLDQLIAMCHELAHSLYDISNKSYNVGNPGFLEIPSMHYENLILFYLTKYEELKDVTLDELQINYNYYINYAQMIFILDTLLQQPNVLRSGNSIKRGIEHLRKSNPNPAYNYLIKKKTILDCCASSDIKYLVGKSIEQALLLLYVQDKERYHYICKKLYTLDWSRSSKEIIRDLANLDIIATDAKIEKYRQIILNPNQH